MRSAWSLKWGSGNYVLYISPPCFHVVPFSFFKFQCLLLSLIISVHVHMCIKLNTEIHPVQFFESYLYAYGFFFFFLAAHWITSILFNKYAVLLRQEERHL